MRQATFDIELALISPSSVREDLQRRLGDTCTFEDRLEQGWGLVIRPAHSNGSSIAEQMRKFLSLFAGNEALIRKGDPILRIAAFNPNATSTVLVGDFYLDRVCTLGARLELSFYPVE
ncbi:hypothetical protein [Cupriavidus necator]|uniref:hypothetical protein n=1 Tax=Cupriavidus necator TaxID=106590 RepID=UPI002788AC46|nr:hypothetical protein [Cupriavidus necator]MDQ0143316.1 hypothetical protein [Cupriavidus necator]